MIAHVIVVPKPVVNDPQGTTVRQGLRALGFSEVTDVRVGKYIKVTLDAASADEAHDRVEEMCRKLLANRVIEDFRFDLLPPDGEPGSRPALNRQGWGGKEEPA